MLYSKRRKNLGGGRNKRSNRRSFMSKRNNKLHMRGGNDRTIENGRVYDKPQTAEMNPLDKITKYGVKPSYQAFCARRVFCESGFAARNCDSAPNNKDVVCVPMTNFEKKLYKV
jgi:hypothetical protein